VIAALVCQPSGPSAKELSTPGIKEVVDKLGTGTFSERALKLTQDTKSSNLRCQ
jgi:hypothetical protein